MGRRVLGELEIAVTNDGRVRNFALFAKENRGNKVAERTIEID